MARFEGVSDRSAAESLRGSLLEIDRDALPPLAEDEYYHADLIGLTCVDVGSQPVGTVIAVENFGASDLLEIELPDGKKSLIPFKPGIADLADGRIVLDPDFGTNRTVYIAFAEGTEESNRTALWKARLHGNQLVGGRVIFRVSEPKKAPSHPGGRLLFLPDKTLLLAVGDGFDYRDKAQDPASHLGKILRLTRDGRAPPDNPFVGRASHAPEIWALGSRNIQGLTRDPVTGTIWAHEHGPRGGDEINELVAGRNYGWPKASFGIDYDGKLITDRQHVDGLTDPRFVWSPSIAPSGLAVYRGAAHPDWDGRLLVGALATRMVAQVRVHPETGLLAEEGRWLTGLKARIRDVRVAPDGHVFLLTDGGNGRLLRLVRPSEVAIASDSPLTPLSWLVGSWTGTSRITPPFVGNHRTTDENSQMDCRPVLKATYIRCQLRFYRVHDGRMRTVEYNIKKTPNKAGFDYLLFDSNWSGNARYTLEWSEAEQAWVATLPTDNDGRPATERIIVKPSADRSTVLHTEAIRLNATPHAPWTETFRWVWTRT